MDVVCRDGSIVGSGLFECFRSLLARASTRAREIATRLALGSSSGRLARQLLAESLLIALAGGLLGIAAAPIGVRVLIAFIPQGTGVNALHAGIDSRLLLCALLVTVTAGIVSGLAPAFQSSWCSLASSLRERGGRAFGRVRLRKVIVTAQIALALTLVVGAGLFVRTVDALMAKGPGFVTSSLVSFGIDAMRGGYSNAEGERVMGRIDEAIHHSSMIQTSAIARSPLLTAEAGTIQ